jgi:DNA-binding transcriptional MerR regulator
MDKIVEFREKIKEYSLPRWDQLPDFEVYMDQVISIITKHLDVFNTDPLTPSMINNYVKLGILPAPVKKRYSKDHIARLIVICLMKNQLPLPVISTFIQRELDAVGMDAFFDAFVEVYESEVKASAENMNKEDSVLDGALSLAITASANLMTASQVFELIVPKAEPVDKKEKKKQ